MSGLRVFPPNCPDTVVLAGQPIMTNRLVIRLPTHTRVATIDRTETVLTGHGGCRSTRHIVRWAIFGHDMCPDKSAMSGHTG